MEKDKEEAEVAKAIGHRILLLRTHLGLSQDDLAKKIACARYLISKWESGQYLISTKHLFAICRELNVPLAYFDIEASGIEDFFKGSLINVLATT